MLLNVILTSYNRPVFLEKTLKSLLAQTDPRWRCYLMDDNSNDETWKVIGDHASTMQFNVYEHDTDEFERSTTTRYSALINEILPRLNAGIVGFLCDNVEYKPTLVEEVLSFFAQNEAFAGYVLHYRDIWKKDGSKKLGEAADFGHWPRTPPKTWMSISSPMGFLDHSQVFHRVPVDIRWDEHISAVRKGDGLYFTKLVSNYGPIHCINSEENLTTEHLLK